MPGKQCDSILLPATNGITNFVRLEAYSNLRYKDICGHNGTSRFKRFNFRRATGNFGLPVVAPMNLMKSNSVHAHFPVLTGIKCRLALFLLSLAFCWFGPVGNLLVAAPSTDSATGPGLVESKAGPRFNVVAYVISGGPTLSTNALAPLFAHDTGTNVSVAGLVNAAAELHQEYVHQGEPMMSVAIPLNKITNGVVTLNVFRTAVPQVVVSGKSYLKFTNAEEITIPEMAGHQPVVNLAAENPPQPPATNSAPPVARPPVALPPAKPVSPEQIALARTVLLREMATNEYALKHIDTRIHVVSTNSGPRFAVEKYLIQGNTALSPKTVAGVLTNIDGAFGTNVSFEGIHAVAEELQRAYQAHGFVTVAVGLPQQKLTNETVKIRVTEGRLAIIKVTGNYYFSSNNVMRALPSLHTNMLLNEPVFRAELNRANANRDRQIYPVVGPGLEPGTSALNLKVKDQLPVHGKLDFNNESTPGTPDFRLNASAEADNLWQLDHSLGVQYGFAPGQLKTGSQWDFYDLPLVANYSAFYRLPLGNPESIENAIDGSSGNFGYDEATRRFNLPPASASPELNVYASRSTIDTGVQNLLNETLFDIPNVRQVFRQENQQGITVNQDVGLQLSKPLPPFIGLRSTLSGGLDFKTYLQANYQTNVFKFVEYTKGPNGNLIQRVTYDIVPTPTTEQKVEYLPLALNYNAGLNDFLGPATVGLGLSANLWFSSSTLYTPATTNQQNVYGSKSLQGITGSSESTGYWLILRPSFSQDFSLYTNWITNVRVDGQYASEPLISNEQFGIGGVNSVRGYHEGEVFGDSGWHMSVEQKTPSHLVGMMRSQPLTLRASVYMDFATAYLSDPNGRAGTTKLWGTGFGFVVSAGSHWQARFLFSVPLIGTIDTPVDAPYFNFGLTSQF